jgi:hypothetical protein
MQISMYSASIPAFIRSLANLRAILVKGAEHAQTHSIDPNALLGFRLYPDMFPLTRQVQIACDMAKGGAARLAGVEPPSFPDDEKTFEDLLARIDKTIAFVHTVTSEQVNGSELRDITLNLRTGPMQFKGQEYLNFFVLPNLYFHAATAYNILRHNGVGIGKKDFLGS